MILILRPPGRGNWTPVTCILEGPRIWPIAFFVGQRVLLGDKEWRVSKVMP